MSKNNILFINVNSQHNVTAGAGYVVGELLEAGKTVVFHDTALSPQIPIPPNIDEVWVSSMTIMYPTALKIKDMLRRYYPDKRFVLGGIHATIIGTPLLQDGWDELCVGEHPCLNNLANLPPFPWHLFPDNWVVQGNGMLYVHATRGCPFRCTYCCNSVYLDMYGKEYLRYRPVAQVLRELSFLKDRYKPQIFYFGDEMMLSDKDYCAEIYPAIKEMIGVPYGIMGRVEYLTDKMVSLLSKTGCCYVGLGIECGDEQFRKDHLNRNMTNQQIIDACKRVKDAGMRLTTFNMVGYPFPNDNELSKATEMLNRIVKPDIAQFTVFYPFPGTELGDYCRKNDLIDPLKAQNGTYYGHSILKGVGATDVLNNLNKEFN